MIGAITQHARFRLAQLQTLAQEAAADAEKCKKVHGAEVEKLASISDGASWNSVRDARDNLDRSEAKAQGAAQILARFAAKMDDPNYLAQLSEADTLEVKVATSDFSATLQSDLGPRIEAAARALAELIPQIVELVGAHSKMTTDLMLAAERVGFRELYAGRMPLDIETGLARFREAMIRGLLASGTAEYFVRGATGIRI